MGRIIDWPGTIGITGMTPLTGPRAVGSSSSESLSGFSQTVAGVSGLWRWQIQIAPMKGKTFREYRGMVAALHGGANALRVPFYDPDGIYKMEKQTWSGGGYWSNGQTWSELYDWEVVNGSFAKGDTEIRLQSYTWGQQLGVGDYIGFLPLHPAIYLITQVKEPGVYRIWPPLRKANPSLATLYPVMAMKLESEQGATMSRELESSGGQSMTLVEVMAEDLADYFLDEY